jgi:hypothetical protein
MKRVFLSAVVLVIALSATAQSKMQRQAAGYVIGNYEVECMGVGVDGTQLIKVWSFGTSPENAMTQARKNAVHAVIFKGVRTGLPGCMMSPLVTKPGAEVQHAEFFNNFFSNGGAYLRFVNQAGDGSIDRIKINKKSYKIGMVVSVLHAQLRSELEAAGIVPKLGQGF